MTQIVAAGQRRLQAAGCERVAVPKPDAPPLGEEPCYRHKLQALLAGMAGLDMVLLEGLKDVAPPKLVVVHPRHSNQLANTQLLATACPNVRGLAGVQPAAELKLLPLPLLDAADTHQVAAFICRVCGISLRAGAVALPG